MALLQCDFKSDVLQLAVSMNVIVPDVALRADGVTGELATLYLLHGLSDDHTIWCRRTSIERYVAEMPLAVVMPAVHRSFYNDMAVGYRYWTFVSEELPRVARWMFPLSAARERNFVAGLSMGGFGAFKLALRQPERFAAAASLSGALDMTARIHDEPEWAAELVNVFGDPATLPGSGNDLLHLAEVVAQSAGPKPRLYQCCGTEDFLYAQNVRYRDHALSLGLDLTYEDGPGEHEWGYWDAQIQRVLAWLPL